MAEANEHETQATTAQDEPTVAVEAPASDVAVEAARRDGPPYGRRRDGDDGAPPNLDQMIKRWKFTSQAIVREYKTRSFFMSAHEERRRAESKRRRRAKRAERH